MTEERIVEAEVVEQDPAKMEFRLINPTEGGFLKHIEWNRSELEIAIRATVSQYQGLSYTEETLALAKKNRAELNKLLKAIEERRKMVKEIINRPYAEFESELKEVTSLIKEQISEIDNTAKAIERQQKEEKKAEIISTYNDNIGELAGILPFEQIFDERYLNKSFKLKAVQDEVRAKIETVKRDLDTIDSMCGKYKLNAKDVYVKTLDLSKALAEEKRLKDLEEKMEADRRRKEEEDRRRAEEARRRREEEEARRLKQERERIEREAVERAAAEQRARLAAEQAASLPEPEEEQPEETAEIEAGPITPMGATVASIERGAFAAAAQPAELVPQKEKKARVRFYAIGTKDQLKALVEYMKVNNIKYGKVE